MKQLIFKKNQRFGRLRVIGENGRNKSGGVKWKCICDCGKICNPSSGALHQGATRSCGCLHKESAARNGRNGKSSRTTHGMSYSPEYKSWAGAVQRCTNPNCTGYEFYGGRGITVCSQWLHSFEQFFKDMGVRPKGTSLDRIDVNGDYKPSNCKWATQKEQNYNTRRKRAEDFSDKELMNEVWRRTPEYGIEVAC